MTGLSAASPAIDASLIARAADELARLNPGGGRIGLAVSGGPDSMALLVLAQASMPGGFAVATVNHGLRKEAAHECALVAETCARIGVDCHVLRVNVADGNVQQEARQARYAALAQWALAQDLVAVATAHHADDQAETLLMRLNRGSGVAGLAGVRDSAILAGMRIIRPLLGFRRAELAQVIATSELAVVDDPSNRDEKFDRVRMRQRLAVSDWIDPAALANSAKALGEAYDALQAYADLLWPQLVEERADALVLTPGPSREMNRRLLARMMDQLGGRPRGGDVARLLRRLEMGEGGNVAGVLARVKAGCWVLRPEPSRRATSPGC